MANDTKKPSLFISYCWKDGNIYADELETQLNDYFHVKRDKSQLIPNDDIYDFMAGIANCDYVIIVLTTDYVHSVNCMLEMSYLAEQDDWDEKTLVLVIDESLYSTDKKMEILTYWQLRQQKILAMANESSIGREILSGEKEYVDSINRQIEHFLYGIARRKNPSQIAIVNEMVRKLQQNNCKEPAEINIREYHILQYIEAEGTVTLAELSSNLGLSKALVTRTIRSLIDKGRIEVLNEGKNRRYRAMG